MASLERYVLGGTLTFYLQKTDRFPIEISTEKLARVR
jgi:hypothetical protein